MPRKRLSQPDDPEPHAEALEGLHSAIHSVTEALQALSLLERGLVFPLIPKGEIDFSKLVRVFEMRLIVTALRHTGGQQKKAAELLNLKPTTLHHKLKLYGLHPKQTVAHDELVHACETQPGPSTLE